MCFGMGNEMTLWTETELPINMTCANATPYEKGALVTLTNPFTISGTVGLAAACAGVVQREKIASDGRTKVAVYRGGIFRGTASGAIAIGQGLITAGSDTNLLAGARANDEHLVGTALEAATDAETFLFELNPFGIELA